MKPIKKRKQNLSSAGEIMNRCLCRTHACSCYPGHDAHVETYDGLYVSAYNMASWGGEPTSISSK